MIDIYLILAWNSLPYHESYMDQFENQAVRWISLL